LARRHDDGNNNVSCTANVPLITQSRPLRVSGMEIRNMVRLKGGMDSVTKPVCSIRSSI
jgi:hypothetical protein